jgi:HSP20 family molecular chaperone IbpA
MDPFGIERIFRDFFEDTYPLRAITGASGVRPSGGGQEIIPAASDSNRLGSFFGSAASSFGRVRVDVTEKPDAYHVAAELPGIPKENIKVSVDNNILCIEAERKEQKKEDNDRLHIVERSYGKFQRNLRLPDNCDTEKPKADFEHGVLSLVFPKKETSTRKAIQL